MRGLVNEASPKGPRPCCAATARQMSSVGQPLAPVSNSLSNTLMPSCSLPSFFDCHESHLLAWPIAARFRSVRRDEEEKAQTHASRFGLLPKS